MPFVEDDQQEIAERVSIAEAFRKFGTDASGKLGRQEFEKAMVLVGNQTDTDGSWVVDLEEFAALVKGIQAGGSQEQQRQHPLYRQQPKEIAVTSAFNSSTLRSSTHRTTGKTVNHRQDVLAVKKHQQQQHLPQNAKSDVLNVWCYDDRSKTLA